MPSVPPEAPELDFLPRHLRGWATEHLWLLDAIAIEFSETGKWPSPREMTRDLARRGQNVVVGDIAFTMPVALGSLRTDPGVVVLSLIGLSCTLAGRGLVDGFVLVLRTSYERFVGSDDAMITSAEVDAAADHAGVSRVALAEIVLRDAPFFEGGGAVDGEWYRDVGAAVVRYADVASADSYLRQRVDELVGTRGWPVDPADEEAGEAAIVPAAVPRGDRRDFFISHAGSDKQQVAKPLADALVAAGWTVWLDQYELTVGDSLNESLNLGLASSRFGVVVLSHAFFDRYWAKQELDGLAARQAASGRKVILPVWHGVDEKFLAERAPMLADKLGVSTDGGIASVAKELIRALELDLGSETVEEEEILTTEEPELPFASVPRSLEERDRLIEDRPPGWEYALFTGEVYLRKQEMESMWLDHELRMPQGERDHLDRAGATEKLTRSFRDISMAVEQIDRTLEPAVQERAFGAPGQPGDPLRIQHLAAAVIRPYGELMRIAGELRNQDVPEEMREPVELAAQLTDQPLREFREWADSAVEQIDGIRDRVAARKPDDPPIQIVMELRITANQDALRRFTDSTRRVQDAS